MDTFKTTDVHRACSKRYYDENKKAILQKHREQYRAKHPIKPKEDKVKHDGRGRPKRPQLTIDDAVVFDETTQRYKRNVNMASPINPVKKGNKHSEFLWIVESVTGEPFVYDKIKWSGKEISNGDCSMCLCSTHIDYNYEITHLPTSKKFIVGSECVKKISKDFYKVIKADRCRVCYEPVLDKRPSHGRDGYCSKECEFPKMKFGKYKGQRIDTLPVTYINWFIDNVTPRDEEIKIAMYRAKVLLENNN
jgi:hypothetical protein